MVQVYLWGWQKIVSFVIYHALSSLEEDIQTLQQGSMFSFFSFSFFFSFGSMTIKLLSSFVFTRVLLKKLTTRLNLPVFALCDYNPSGVSIMVWTFFGGEHFLFNFFCFIEIFFFFFLKKNKKNEVYIQIWLCINDWIRRLWWQNTILFNLLWFTPPPTKKMTCKNCFFLDLAVNELKWLGLRYHDFDKLEFGEVFQKYREKDEQTLNGLLRSPHIRVWMRGKWIAIKTYSLISSSFFFLY